MLLHQRATTTILHTVRLEKTVGASFRRIKHLPLSVIKHLKPIFEDLSSDKLLQECLHGKTQNQNEAFNGTIWERIPKIKFVSFAQLKFGVYDAVANFNIGKKASVLIIEKLNMVPGENMLKGCRTANKRRLFHSSYKSLETSKKRRKIIRGKKNLLMIITKKMRGLFWTNQENFTENFTARIP